MTETLDGDDQAWPDRPHLRDSRQLNWCRTTTSPAALDIIGQLVAEVDAHATRRRARRAEDRRRLQATLQAMVLDLVFAAEQPRQPWVSYSRRDVDYRVALARYLSPDIAFTAAVAVADFLEGHGYAEGSRGNFIRPRQGFGGYGYRSRLRALPKLVELFHARGVGQADIAGGNSQELVRLKGPPEDASGRKPLIPYGDTDTTRRMRQQLKDWAAVVNRFDITFAEAGLAEDADAEADEEAEYADPTTAALYRVFNDGSWERGGRFYGGAWQSLPKAVRGTIRIDGEPTVELDFKSLHPRLLYHLEGRPVLAGVDPYLLGGPWTNVDRDVLKVAFNQLLALRGDGTPRKPTGAKLPARMTYKALVQAVEAQHAPIAGWFRQGRAAELQNIDAKIAEGVLQYMTVVRGRPVLPVHDSFIVAARDESMLGQTMSLAYRAVLADVSGVAAWPVISGWSSAEKGEAVYELLRATDRVA